MLVGVNSKYAHERSNFCAWWHSSCATTTPMPTDTDRLAISPIMALVVSGSG